MILAHHDLITLICKRNQKRVKAHISLSQTEKRKYVVQPFPFHKKNYCVNFLTIPRGDFLFFCRKSSF